MGLLPRACGKFVGVDNKQWNESDRRYCEGFNSAVVRAVRQLDPRLVILNAHWIDLDADLIPPPGGDPADSNFKRGLQETMRETASVKRSDCIVLDVPEYKYDLPTALAVARRRGISEDFLKLTRAEAQEHFSGQERDIRALARQHPPLQVVDPKDLLCRESACLFESDGQLLYGDPDHLSRAGAQFIAGSLDGCFRNITSVATK
jgi:hypothetical protein